MFTITSNLNYLVDRSNSIPLSTALSMTYASSTGDGSQDQAAP